jgi:tetratricopeptide (TPR) repeat protein
LYEKALTTTNNHPLIMVGRGHIDLRENKTNEARQMFESAITNSRGRKGNDPGILLAVGRAINDSKAGDFKWAVKLLKEASDISPKDPMIWVELGNAYRKAGGGEGGGDAFKSYKEALAVSPNFARASLRLAQLFESQRNWSLVLNYLLEATQKDPNFSAGYYELFYYYFYRQQYADAEKELQKYINSKGEKEIEDEYLYAQLCWAKKDWACAVTKAESVVTALGENTKPKVYRLLADSYNEKGDYTSAKRYSDLFLARKNPDDLGLYDFELRAKILDKTGGTDDEILNTYMQAVTVDTPVSYKVDLMRKGVTFFKDAKKREQEAILLEKIVEIRPKPSTINDLFDLGVAYYFGGNYSRSREVFQTVMTQFPDQVYGYEWSYNSAVAVDTVKKDSIAVPDALNLLAFAEKDTVKYKKQYISSVRFLAAYYINEAKDVDKSLEYFRKWLAADVDNREAIQSYIDQIEKQAPRGRPAPKPSSTKKSDSKANDSTKNGSATRKAPDKS